MRRSPIAAALVTWATLASGVASAQTVAQTMGATLLDYTNPMNPSTHPNNVDATWISYSDCENDATAGALMGLVRRRRHATATLTAPSRRDS
jgi:hypothetical protein